MRKVPKREIPEYLKIVKATVKNELPDYYQMVIDDTIEIVENANESEDATDAESEM